MSYPDQRSVGHRLNEETRRAMRQMEEAGVEHLSSLWDETKAALRAAVAGVIASDFRGARWDLPAARRRGTFHKVERAAARILEAFHAGVSPKVEAFLREARFQEMSRTLWMMTQLSPPGAVVRLPTGARVAREAERGLSGQTSVVTRGMPFSERMDAWLRAYRDALIHNLSLGALGGGDMMDAVAEVDATRVGSPSVDLWDALERMLRTEFAANTYGAGGGHDDAMEANPDAPFVEVWQARADGRVCPECEANDQLPRSEVDDDIPLHPNCRCAWILRPKSWVEMGGVGDPDHEPTAMLIRGEDGRVGGAMVVSYSDWVPPNRENLDAARRTL